MMETVQIPDSERHKYRLDWGRAGFLLFWSLFMSGVGLYSAYGLTSDLGRSLWFLLLPSALLFTVLGVRLFVFVFRARVILESNRLEVRYAFRTRKVDVDEIEGIRVSKARYYADWQIQLKNGREILCIAQELSGSGDPKAWFARFPDLDQSDGQQILNSLKATNGTTSAGAWLLEKALYVNIALCFLSGIAIFAWWFTAYIFQLPLYVRQILRTPAMALLALIPLIALYLLRSRPLLYALFNSESDPRTDLIFPLLISCFALAMGSFSLDYVAYGSIFLYAFPAALFIGWAIFYSTNRPVHFWGQTLFIVMIGMLYGWGVTAAANVIFDPKPAAIYQATVHQKYMSSGRGAQYNLVLEPWGPVEFNVDLEVSQAKYDRAKPGDIVCLVLHPGAFHAAWYEQTDCPAGTQH